MEKRENECQVWILIRNDVFCEPCFDAQIVKAAVHSCAAVPDAPVPAAP